jgi:signal transduction histidine kinase
MNRPASRPRILTVSIRGDDDVVTVRQRARTIAATLGLDVQDQTRVSTAVSELARNVQQYAGEGQATFEIDDAPDGRYLLVVFSDRGPGITSVDSILGGTYISSTGMGVGLAGARRLSDRFEIETKPGAGTTVTIGKRVPVAMASIPDILKAVTAALAATKPRGATEELREQNRALLAALATLEEQRVEADRLNAELSETNRGVVALYAELDERAEDLRRASESKSRFLSMISHELRTPLTSVLNLTRLLLDRMDGDLTSEQERQITLIRKSVLSLTEMVNDLLDLAKIEAGKTSMRLAPVLVSEMISGLRGVFRPVMQNDAVALSFEDVDPALTLCTDEGKLAQVLRNFVSNAVKFTERGEIRLSVLFPAEDRITFEVCDTGMGIAPDDQQRIFQDFAQVDNPKQRHVKGTGLGLSLSRKIAHLLDGEIGVRSTVGEGSTFWICIPRFHPRADPNCVETIIEMVGEVVPAIGENAHDG